VRGASALGEGGGRGEGGREGEGCYGGAAALDFVRRMMFVGFRSVWRDGIFYYLNYVARRGKSSVSSSAAADASGGNNDEGSRSLICSFGH
jgi:hypothetical protein